MTRFLIASLAAAAAVAAAPVFKVDRAHYRLDAAALELVFTFANPTDSVLYLDCQGEPAAAKSGKTLRLTFAGARDSGAAAASPVRVGPGQTYQGARQLDAKAAGREDPAIPLDVAGFTHLEVRMAWFPERVEGEGAPYLAERAALATVRLPLAKSGKRPPAPPARKTREYVPPERSLDDN